MKRFLIYALVIFFTGQLSAQSNDLTVHEWGTFTTLAAPSGELLNGQIANKVRSPDYIKHVDTTVPREKYQFDDKVRMRKPNAKFEYRFIQFYTQKTFPFKCRIDFPNGTINEFHPQRTNGEKYHDVRKPGLTVHGHVGMPFYLRYLELHLDYQGWIKWQGDIFATEAHDQFNYSIHETMQPWSSVSQVESNIIKTKSSSSLENHLFYRSSAHIDPGLKVAYNYDRNLVLANEYSNEVPYVLVIDNSDSEMKVLWEGNLVKNQIKIVGSNVSQCTDCLDSKLQNLSEALVKEGLFPNEAEALVSTWDKRSFALDNVKVFWIMPPSSVSELMPITITPIPSNLTRVLVGKSEILPLKPGKKYCKDTLTTIAKTNRFYKNLKNYCKSKSSHELSHITKNGYLKGGEFVPDNSMPHLFPNPANDQLNLSMNPIRKDGKLEIIDNQGKVVHRKHLPATTHQARIDIHGLAPGVYHLSIQSDTTLSKSFVKQ